MKSILINTVNRARSKAKFYFKISSNILFKQIIENTLKRNIPYNNFKEAFETKFLIFVIVNVFFVQALNDILNIDIIYICMYVRAEVNIYYIMYF